MGGDGELGDEEDDADVDLDADGEKELRDASAQEESATASAESTSATTFAGGDHSDIRCEGCKKAKEDRERTRRFHVLFQLLTTEVGYLVDLRALVSVRPMSVLFCVGLMLLPAMHSMHSIDISGTADNFGCGDTPADPHPLLTFDAFDVQSRPLTTLPILPLFILAHSVRFGTVRARSSPFRYAEHSIHNGTPLRRLRPRARARTGESQ